MRIRPDPDPHQWTGGRERENRKESKEKVKGSGIGKDRLKIELRNFIESLNVHMDQLTFGIGTGDVERILGLFAVAVHAVGLGRRRCIILAVRVKDLQDLVYTDNASSRPNICIIIMGPHPHFAIGRIHDPQYLL